MHNITRGGFRLLCQAAVFKSCMRLEIPPTLTDGDKHFFEVVFKRGNRQAMTVKMIFHWAVTVQNAKLLKETSQKKFPVTFVDKKRQEMFNGKSTYFTVAYLSEFKSYICQKKTVIAILHKYIQQQWSEETAFRKF